MITLRTALSAAVLSLVVSAPVFAKAVVGEAAPAFTLTDSNGKARSLAEFKGKTVVLEWTNAECPFVKKHYGSGNMQAQQKEATGEGVVWLTINSGAPGKQGAVDGAGANAVIKTSGGAQTAYLLDPQGSVGHDYGAKTTPHMYIIDGDGKLRYMGGIDSIQSADQADVPKATQYVRQALGELKGGKAVSVSASQPYGCSVKYGT
jgi:peroxiredoxin